MHASLPRKVVLNGFEVDLEGDLVRRPDGGASLMRPQSFAALRYLISNANRLVSKAELHEAVWRGAAVTDDSLVQCIHAIRQALADHDRSLLQTVSRRGYRLNLPEDRATAPGRSSIAVLPFAMAGEVESSFVDGLAEEVITGLSRLPGLFVIARNSSFAYRGQSIDLRRIASELGVRYLLDGSVRRVGRKLRINAHLIDGGSAVEIWAGRFEGTVEDVFELQDELTERLVGVLEPSLRRAEIDRARRKAPGRLDAYDLYLRAVPLVLTNKAGGTDEALRLLQDALALDPGFLPAHGYAAWLHEQRYFRGGLDPADRAAALAHSDVVLGVNADDPQAMSFGAFVRSMLTGDYDAALAVFDRALAINASSALVYGLSAMAAAHCGRDERAVEHARKALRLSPLDDPLRYHPFCALAVAGLFAGRFEEAAAYARLTIQANPAFSVPYAYLAVAHVKLGEPDAAAIAMRGLLDVDPGFTVEGFAKTDRYPRKFLHRLVAALAEVEVAR
ncbi:winged helix-turn-helix domain-containing protein (plasmid) [Salipiger sp. H15]|uniref:Winged helix-turn-helix domain-containing protein n=1 Tax=Alloyangia sp. H15 TaxID=3029062 RepID=A0AAU8AQN7_9RHOB